MGEGVVGVELQAIPLALAQIHLQRVVIGVSAGRHVLGLLAGSIGISLEEVDGLASTGTARIARISAAWSKAGTHKIAEIGCGSQARECTRKGSCLSGLQVIN